MIETPQIVQTDEQLAAVIPLRIPRSEIRMVMGPGLEELLAAVTRQAIEIIGPWYSHHFRMDPEVFDFEIGVPVASPVAESGRVRPGSLPAARVARTVYHGGYEGLGAAWGEFDHWVKTNGHTPAPDLWECYLIGPESGPDTSTYRTQLNRPLA